MMIVLWICKILCCTLIPFFFFPISCRHLAMTAFQRAYKYFNMMKWSCAEKDVNFEFFYFVRLALTAGIEHHLQDFFGIRERLSSSWCGMMNEWIFSVNGRNVRRSSRPFQCWKILLRCHFTRRHSVFHSPRTREFLNHLCHPTRVRRGEAENTTNLTPFGLYYSFSSKPPTTSPSNRPQHQNSTPKTY